MNLYLFPESANPTNGYSIVVNNDYDQLQPDEQDAIVWYSSNLSNNIKYKDGDIVVQRPKLISAKRCLNILHNRFSAELTAGELSFLQNKQFQNIFCGDVVFYRAIRKLFPHNKLMVRFHNCFARISDRQCLLNISLDPKFKMDMRAFYRLEKEIFADKNAYKIFLSEEDKTYYKLMTGCNDCEVLPVVIDEGLMFANRKSFQVEPKIVWLGGVETHKKTSVKWFIKSVFPVIKSQIPDVEFHLWGRRTMQFDAPDKNIFAHGYFKGNDIPFRNSALFINPDMVGGGVKIKVKTYFEEGIKFISTPFGYEGFLARLIDNDYCFVVETEKWAEAIVRILRK